MQNMLKQKVTVQPGGTVHIESPELVPGSVADVIIIPETPAGSAATLTSLFSAAAGGFTTPRKPMRSFVKNKTHGRPKDANGATPLTSRDFLYQLTC